MQIRIYYEDTDISGFVYHTNYLKYCERARSEAFFTQGISPIDGNSHFVVKSIDMQYIKPAMFGDKVEVKTKVLKIANASVLLQQNIYKDGQILFSATIKLAHLIGMKPAKISQKTKDIFAKF